MKTKLPSVLLAVLALGAGAGVAQNAVAPAAPAAAVPGQAGRPLEARLREGLYLEEATQDLEAARKAYGEILASFDQDRATAASALFRLGEVSRKLKQPDAAKDAFRRIVRDFSDREPLVRLARENLKALGEPLPEDGPGSGAAPADPEQDKALARLQELEKQSPDLLLSPQTSLAGNGYISYDEALQAGYLRVVTWLLERGASVDRTPSGRTPLALAAEKGQTPLVELLLSRKAVIDGPEKAPSPLYMAAEKGHRAVAALLIERGAAVDGGGGEKPVPLIAAVRGGNKSVTALLLEKGADANASEGAALMEAVLKDDEAAVTLLLAHKADPNKAARELRHTQTQVPGATPGNYHHAWDGLTLEVRKSIPGKPYEGYGTWEPAGADMVSALHLACLRKQEAIIAALIEAGADVNAKTKLGSTPLEAACVSGSPGAMQRLIKAGAKGDAVAPGGVRLVELALMKHEMALYEVLQKAGAPVAGASPCGLTPLEALKDWSYSTGKDEKFDPVFERLLEDGADPNGSEKFRPVLFLVQAGKAHLIPALKKKGADFRPPGLLSPVAAAIPRLVETGDISVIKALIDAGADVDGVCPVPNPFGFGVPADRTQTALTALVQAVPKPEVLEAFLALKPTPGETRQAVFEDTKRGWASIAEREKVGDYDTPVRDPATGDGTTMDEQKARSERRQKIMERLWAYQRDEWNPERWTRPWVEAVTSDKTPAMTTFCPAGRSAAPVTVLEAMVYALSGARYEDKDGDATSTDWNEGCADYTKLVIRRVDAKTHAVLKDEPVDLMALAATGDASLLPVLHPGDVLAFISGGKHNGDNPDKFPDLLRTVAAKIYDRDITLSAGGVKLALKLGVPRSKYDFLQDPSRRVLPVEPTLGTVLAYLPKPDFFYRMEKVTLKRKDGTTQTVDARQPLTAAQDVALTSGDEIVLEPVPLDDAGLKARVAQGIFIGREADGFLAEVMHATGAPDLGGWTDDLKQGVLRQFCTESQFVLPWMDVAKLRTGPVLPGEAAGKGPWGQVLEVPRGPEVVDDKPEGGAKWAGPNDPASPEKLLMSGDQVALRLEIEVRGKGKAAHLFYHSSMTFTLKDDRWAGYPTGTSGALTTRALPRVVEVLDRSRSYGGPKLAAKSRWEVRRKGEEKPLAAFTPGKDEIPFLWLKDGDTLSLDEVDVPLLRAPDVRKENGKQVYWMSAKLVPDGNNNGHVLFNGVPLPASGSPASAVPTPVRRRVVTPTNEPQLPPPATAPAILPK